MKLLNAAVKQCGFGLPYEGMKVQTKVPMVADALGPEQKQKMGITKVPIVSMKAANRGHNEGAK